MIPTMGPTARIDTAETTEGRQAVATYATYSDAQRAVDHLSDSSFPVEHTAIVGYDLRVVEHVTGRVTKGRAAATGAGGGAWFGLFFGLIIGLFTTGPEWLGLMLGGLLIGAFAGRCSASSPTGRRGDSATSCLPRH